MEYQPVIVQNSLLEKGRTYPFMVLGLMNLESDDSLFVLRDPLGYKMLLQARHYMHYQIKENTSILCRIDKINCNGRIYLEPQNPWYIEGRIYPFEVVGSGIRIDITGLPLAYYLVKDNAGKRWTVKLHQTELPYALPDVVTCTVSRIKKGIMYLRLENESKERTSLEDGRTYPFTMLGESRDPNNGTAFYILQDEQGDRYAIKKKFYKKYNLAKGNTVQCRITGLTDEGQLFLEPEHPFYVAGNTYTFPVAGRKEFRFSDGSRQKFIVIEDLLGEEVNVPVDEKVAAYWAKFDKVVCRVVNIEKSRLVAELVEGQS